MKKYARTNKNYMEAIPSMEDIADMIGEAIFTACPYQYSYCTVVDGAFVIKVVDDFDAWGDYDTVFSCTIKPHSTVYKANIPSAYVDVVSEAINIMQVEGVDVKMV